MSKAAAKKEETVVSVYEEKAQSLAVPGFNNMQNFELMQRQAKLLASSTLVPKAFQNNIPDTVIALEIAGRIGASPFAVMQNIDVIHGKPSWSAKFIIAAVNSTGRFSPLRYTFTGEGMDRVCVAWALEKATGERLESPPVSMKMAKDEGWLTKNGSKWKTMPDLMMCYRTATFFGRLYAPEILMGMQTIDEARDVGPEREAVVAPTTEELSTRLDEDSDKDTEPDDIPEDLGNKKAPGDPIGCTTKPTTCEASIFGEGDKPLCNAIKDAPECKYA